MAERQPERLPVELQRPVEIGHTDESDRDSTLEHAGGFPSDRSGLLRGVRSPL